MSGSLAAKYLSIHLKHCTSNIILWFQGLKCCDCVSSVGLLYIQSCTSDREILSESQVSMCVGVWWRQNPVKSCFSLVNAVSIIFNWHGQRQLTHTGWMRGVIRCFTDSCMKSLCYCNQGSIGSTAELHPAKEHFNRVDVISTKHKELNNNSTCCKTEFLRDITQLIQLSLSCLM